MAAIDDMKMFESVVTEGSFTDAADKLGVPSSTLSDRIKRLEDRLGVQLLERTTRSLSLTDAGATYFSRCREITALVADAERAVQAHRLEPQGRLRISAPTLFGRYYLGSVIESFLDDWPEMQVELFLTNRRVHLLEEGFDLAIRVGELAASSLKVRRIGRAEVVCVVSPKFLKHHPCQTRDDLQVAPKIGLQDPETWSLQDGFELKFEPVVTVNDMELARDFAIAGLGIARTPSMVVDESLERGDLVRLRPEACTTQGPIYALYPGRRFVAPRVRLFLDLLVKYMEEETEMLV